MELKKLEQQRERDRAAGILVDEHIPPLDEWRPNAGLGIGMSSNVQEKGQPAASRPKEGLSASRSSSPTKERVDKALPPPPSSFDPDRSSQAMSRPKGITSDVAPSSIFSHQDQRPSLRPRANTLSAQDILSTESALERLALGPSQTSLHEGVIKNGSGKAVQVEQKRIISSDYVPSSSPIESGFDHGSHDFPPRPSSTQSSSQLPLAAQTRAQQASPPVEASALSSTSAAAEKARRDAELMPPPPLPSSRPTHLCQPSDTLLPPRSTSPTPSGYSSSGNEGPKGREDAINARKREKRAEAGGEPVKKEKKARGRARRSLSTGDSSLLEVSKQPSPLPPVAFYSELTLFAVHLTLCFTSSKTLLPKLAPPIHPIPLLSAKSSQTLPSPKTCPKPSTRSSITKTSVQFPLPLTISFHFAH
jgi:hypothetical protein